MRSPVLLMIESPMLRATLALVVLLPVVTLSAQYQKKTLVAHRGASAYAPEHTLAAYRLAMAQGIQGFNDALHRLRRGQVT